MLSSLALPPAPAAVPRRGREGWLDTLRAIAIVRVVFYHAVGYTSAALSAAFSFAFPAMGVMFALGGSLMAASLDRSTARRTILHRMRRLLPSLWLLGLVLVPVMIARGWRTDTEHPLRWAELGYWLVPVVDPPGSTWGGQFTGVLWYLRAYVWFVVLSPVLLRAFRRWPVATVLFPFAVLAAVCGDWLPVQDPLGDLLADFGTYGACWILGFAHRDGRLRRLNRAVVAALAVPLGAAGAWWAASHPAAGGYDLNDIPVAQALYSTGFVLILLRLAPSMGWVRRHRVPAWLVGTLNARAVTIYLWHEVAFVVNGPVLDFLDRYTLGWELSVSWVLVAVAVLLFGWVADLAARRPVRLVPGVALRRPRSGPPTGGGGPDPRDRAARDRAAPDISAVPVRPGAPAGAPRRSRRA